MKPDTEIRGENVILREQRTTDAQFFAHWFSEPDVMFKCGFTEPTDEEAEEKYITNNYKSEGSIIILDPQAQHKGYGSEAIRITLDMAFEKYDMNRVAIGVVGLNTNALEFYRKIGFRQEGIQEQGYYYNGEYSDFIMMRILREEWK